MADFIEIGRRDIWDERRVAEFRSDVRYFAVNLLDTCRENPALIGTMLSRLVGVFETGELNPLPLRVFPLKEVASGFRYMAQAKHIGKIVFSHSKCGEGLTCLPGYTASDGQISFTGDGSYLITGGLGGLGLQVAQWLVGRGAKDLVLMGRSAASSEVNQKLCEFREGGVRLEVIQGDVAEEKDVQNILSHIEAQVGPLRGIFHCAGVVADSLISQQDWRRFDEVLSPKVAGTWNLHILTRNLPLDFFIIFSSVASVLGSAGQANHASACAFQDGLSHFRRLKGLPAMSINWGPWSTVGAVVKHHVGKRLEDRGILTISPDEGMRLLTKADGQ